MVAHQRRTRVAISVARNAAAEIRRARRPRLPRLKRNASDLQTATDRMVERLIRERLGDAFPGESVVGEETTDLSRVDWDEPTWLVDPVDGTTNYFRGLPAYAVNIAFWDGADVIAAVTADVPRRRVYWAERGRGAWRGRQRVHVSLISSLPRAFLTTGFPYDVTDPATNNVDRFLRVMPLVRGLRRIGCAGLDMVAVASGTTDGYWERGSGPWDWAAGALLVREAGGTVTALDGSDWHPLHHDVLATNSHIHRALLACLQPDPPPAVRTGG